MVVLPDVLALAKKLGIEKPVDVNHDGKIDASDVRAMAAKKALVGKGK